MKIGIDFDNTIAGYDRVFAVLAAERGVAPVDAGKRSVRDALRARGDAGEVEWQRLQAAAYGRRMTEADLIPGVAEFLDACRARGVEVHVVSHKTRYANLDTERVDLRQAALAWMRRRGVIGKLGLDDGAVHFADTRADKIACIADLGLTHFIDDLEEVFAEPTFPTTVEAILYDPSGALPRPLERSLKLSTFPRWRDITEHVFASH